MRFPYLYFFAFGHPIRYRDELSEYVKPFFRSAQLHAPFSQLSSFLCISLCLCASVVNSPRSRAARLSQGTGHREALTCRKSRGEWSQWRSALPITGIEDRSKRMP